MSFTDKQIEMLYEMSEIHFNWFNKYAPESPIRYEDVLRLNVVKMTDIVDSCYDCSEDMIDFVFESVIRDYKTMLDGYNFDEDDFNEIEY